LVQKSSRINAYNVLAVPILLHGSEIWDFRIKGEKRLTTIEMKILRRTAGYELFVYKKKIIIMKKFWKSGK
jgi:hypothetical protein